jgi:hypothetical protein
MAAGVFVQKVSIPKSVEFGEVREFVQKSEAVRVEFGELSSVDQADRYRVEHLGEKRSGKFTFRLVGTRRKGEVSAMWQKAGADAPLEVTEIWCSDPWPSESKRIFLKR